jgi:DNA-binding MarR family transcriptional regulator
MVDTPRVTMTMRDLDRLKCIQGVIDRQLRLYQAAERLNLTTRQVRRLVRRYEQEGPVGLISRHRNRPSNRRIKAAVADHAFAILREQYADFGPTLAAEKLRERHGVNLAVETVRSLMVAGGLWLPRRLRPPKIQQLRARRPCAGELIQIVTTSGRRSAARHGRARAFFGLRARPVSKARTLLAFIGSGSVGRARLARAQKEPRRGRALQRGWPTAFGNASR